MYLKFLIEIKSGKMDSCYVILHVTGQTWNSRPRIIEIVDCSSCPRLRYIEYVEMFEKFSVTSEQIYNNYDY